MIRPGVSEQVYDRVLEYGEENEFFEDSLVRLLDVAPPPHAVAPDGGVIEDE